jgi:hypothetical protein
METWKAILIGAAGTWVIAVIALAQRFGALFLRPTLRVEMEGFSGTIARHGNGLSARYYLMRVRNPRRVPPADEVQLVLTQIEKSGPHGPEMLFDEIMPLGWARQELAPLLTRKIGPDALAALFLSKRTVCSASRPLYHQAALWLLTFPNFIRRLLRFGLCCGPCRLRQTAARYD